MGKRKSISQANPDIELIYHGQKIHKWLYWLFPTTDILMETNFLLAYNIRDYLNPVQRTVLPMLKMLDREQALLEIKDNIALGYELNPLGGSEEGMEFLAANCVIEG